MGLTGHGGEEIGFQFSVIEAGGQGKVHPCRWGNRSSRGVGARVSSSQVSDLKFGVLMVGVGPAMAVRKSAVRPSSSTLSRFAPCRESATERARVRLCACVCLCVCERERLCECARESECVREIACEGERATSTSASVPRRARQRHP